MSAQSRSRSNPKTKSKFSGFTLTSAYKQLNITKLIPWQIDADSIVPSDFFNQRLEKLKRFDLRVYEESKKLLIDAICEEGLEGLPDLKIWKGANLETGTLTGYSDSK